jgi:hypothetical protein
MMRVVMLALAGCGSVLRVEVQEVKVPVPVECREPIPDRPAMPTEALAEDAAIRVAARRSGRDRPPRGL